MNGSLWKDDYHASGNWDTVCYTAFVRYLKLISTFQVYSKLQNRTLSYHTDYNIFAGMYENNAYAGVPSTSSAYLTRNIRKLGVL